MHTPWKEARMCTLSQVSPPPSVALFLAHLSPCFSTSLLLFLVHFSLRQHIQCTSCCSDCFNSLGEGLPPTPDLWRKFISQCGKGTQKKTNCYNKNLTIIMTVSLTACVDLVTQDQSHWIYLALMHLSPVFQIRSLPVHPEPLSNLDRLQNLTF